MNKIQDYKETILTLNDLTEKILYTVKHDHNDTEIELLELKLYDDNKSNRMLNFIYRYENRYHENKIGEFDIAVSELFDDHFPECYFERIKKEEEEKKKFDEYRKKSFKKQQYQRFLELKAQFEREPYVDEKLEEDLD